MGASGVVSRWRCHVPAVERYRSTPKPSRASQPASSTKTSCGAIGLDDRLNQFDQLSPSSTIKTCLTGLPQSAHRLGQIFLSDRLYQIINGACFQSMLFSRGKCAAQGYLRQGLPGSALPSKPGDRHVAEFRIRVCTGRLCRASIACGTVPPAFIPGNLIAVAGKQGGQIPA